MSPRSVSALFAAILACGCTSFATVRPATVTPGPSLTAHAGASTPPGDEVAWFFSYECPEDCNEPIVATDIALAHGSVPPNGKSWLPFTIGAGVSGIYPYVEAYVQLRRAPGTPFGIGARRGVTGSWKQHQLYMRFEKTMKGKAKLLWNPGMFWHSGTSPNGENPGRMVALVNGFGIDPDANAPAVIIPSASVVFSRASRESYGESFGPATTVFATFGLSLHYRRTSRDE